MKDRNPLSGASNSPVCEAVGCDSKATTKIGVRLGLGGTILLYLCDNCKQRFSSQKPERRASEIGGNPR